MHLLTMSLIVEGSRGNGAMGQTISYALSSPIHLYSTKLGQSELLQHETLV